MCAFSNRHVHLREMIEIDNEPAFMRGYHTQWLCRRCNQEVPDERKVGPHPVRDVLRSIDCVYDAAITARVSTCRLIIIVITAALVGALTVGTVDRAAPLHLATPFDDAVIDLIRGLGALLVYGLGAAILGILVDQKLTGAIQIRASYNRPQRNEIAALDPIRDE
jgi:hypothetical protein